MAGAVINAAGNHGANHASKEAGFLSALREVMADSKKTRLNGKAATSTH